MDGPIAPYTFTDAVTEIKEVLGREPYDEEVNDWLYEMNEPFSHDPVYVDIGLPGYSESYQTGNTRDAAGTFGTSSILLLLLAAGATGLAYRRFRSKNTDDDEFVKTNHETSLLGRLRNPFNRKKRDEDDDFDKVL